MVKKKIKKIPEEPITGGFNPSDIEFKDLREEEEEFMKKRVKGSKPPSKKKRKPSMEGDMIDLKGGGKIKGYKKGGPITYRMTGGQVVDNSYD